MAEKFVNMLAVGRKTNSLGKTNEVIELTLKDKSRLDELYSCLFDDDAWVRMRAADALEKICRQHPDWLLPYVDRFQSELASSNQPSIQWHLAQIYSQVKLTHEQKANAITWLKILLFTTNVDWIVAANAMDTLVHFTKDGTVPKDEVVNLIKKQQKHRSKSVIKRANKLITELATVN